VKKWGTSRKGTTPKSDGQGVWVWYVSGYDSTHVGSINWWTEYRFDQQQMTLVETSMNKVDLD
jgi:hypothetical protein